MIDHNYGIYLDKNIEPEPARAWRNDPEIRRWCRQTGLISWRNQIQWLEAQNDDPTIEMYSIHAKDEKFVGVCGLTSINMYHRTAEFSLYTAWQYRGHGFASGALKTLLHFAFQELNLNRVWGEVLDTNPALNLFVEKIGFRHEGTLTDHYFKDGKYWDAHRIGMTRKDFECLEWPIV